VLGGSIAFAAEGGAPARDADDVEVGDATPYAGGYAVGLVHRTQAGRTAAVALVDSGAARAELVDLAATLGDAPPPRIAPWGAGVVALAYGVPRANARGEAPRELSVYTVAPGEAAISRASVEQQRDDSLAFDVASTKTTALAVWDEAAAGPHGIVRVADVTPGAAASVGRTITPPESDAETPRVVATPSGFVVLWLARKPETATRDDDRPVAEAPGEERTFGWVEALALDPRGSVASPVRRLTSESGHVSAFDAQLLSDASLLVIARDDGETVDGSGGVLVRVRLVGDRIEPPLALSNDGLGRGGPALVEGTPPWLGWVGPRESLRLMPLDVAGTPSGRPSFEDALVDGRPLAVVAGTSTGAARVLVATPSDRSAPLHAATCAR
jgi:hypothetical protein